MRLFKYLLPIFFIIFSNLCWSWAVEKKEGLELGMIEVDVTAQIIWVSTRRSSYIDPVETAFGPNLEVGSGFFSASGELRQRIARGTGGSGIVLSIPIHFLHLFSSESGTTQSTPVFQVNLEGLTQRDVVAAMQASMQQQITAISGLPLIQEQLQTTDSTILVPAPAGSAPAASGASKSKTAGKGGAGAMLVTGSGDAGAVQMVPFKVKMVQVPVAGSIGKRGDIRGLRESRGKKAIKVQQVIRVTRDRKANKVLPEPPKRLYS